MKKLLKEKEDLEKNIQKKQKDEQKIEADDKKQNTNPDKAAKDMKRLLVKMEWNRKDEIIKLKDRIARNERSFLGRKKERRNCRYSNIFRHYSPSVATLVKGIVVK